MQNYFYFYFISTIIAIYGGISVFGKYKNLSGLFFLVYTILASTWLILYFLFFSEIGFSESERLLLSRINFGLSPIILSIFLLFIYFFKKTDQKIPILYFIRESGWKLVLFLIFSISIFSLAVGTDLIIQGIEQDMARRVYREIPGSLIWINTTLYIIFIPLAWSIFHNKNKNLTYVDRIRLSKIVISMLLFLTFIIFIQILLPMYNIWLFENELILFFAISVLVIANVIKRYYFSPIGYELSKYIGVILGLIILSGMIWVSINYSESTTDFLKYNSSSFIFILAYSSFTVGMTYIIYGIYNKIIHLKKNQSELEENMKKIKRGMIQFLDFDSVNKYLQEEFLKRFPSESMELILIREKKRKDYFLKVFLGLENKFLINDFVYTIENSTEFDLKKIATKLDDPFLCVPILHKSTDILGLIVLGKKSLGDFYTTKEIGFLEELAHVLSIHLKYIETYNQLEDISRNLDRKVDEKTIEYNTLISRQKEFIATLSHEIKAPLTSALLQIDNLSADIEGKILSEDGVREEIVSIGENLAHTKTLLSQLFTTEYLEKNQATLYPERINIVDLTLSQYHIQKKVHQDILYTESTPHGPVFMGLDKTQFTQVLTNLFTNAAKFANAKNPEIYLDLTEDESAVTIGIEDNGHGLNGIELDEIFEKYTIGKNSIGLGIGLYLCKRIVELHHGTISAKRGKKLSGIRMEICIPFE